MLVDYEALTNTPDNYGPITINEARKYKNEKVVCMLEQLQMTKSTWLSESLIEYICIDK